MSPGENYTLFRGHHLSYLILPLNCLWAYCSSISRREPVEIQMIIDYEHANEFHSRRETKSLPHFRTTTTAITTMEKPVLHLFSSPPQYSWLTVLWILLWISCNIYLVPSLIKELNKILDTCSFYICMSHDSTLIWKLYFDNLKDPFECLVDSPYSWLNFIAQVVNLKGCLNPCRSCHSSQASGEMNGH